MMQHACQTSAVLARWPDVNCANDQTVGQADNHYTKAGAYDQSVGQADNQEL